MRIGPGHGATAPLVVAETTRSHAAARAEAEGAGWTLAKPDAEAGPHTLLELTVRDATGVRTAVLAAVRGVGLLALARADRDVVDDLVEDLRHVGPVLLLDANPVLLDVETWRLLHALGGGATVAAAARALHVSMSTANRRLGEARDTFGVDSRAQLLRALSAPDRILPIPQRD